MKRWILKTAVQHIISWLPWSHRCNELFQRYVTKGLVLRPADFEAKLLCCRKHWEHYRTFSEEPKEEATAVELGTGPFPIVPVGLYLCGVGSITTYDLVPLIRSAGFRRMLELFCEYDQDRRLQAHVPCVRPERMRCIHQLLDKVNGASPSALLAMLNIRTRIGDARRTGLSAGTVDFVFSNVVLEHIPRIITAGLFSEFRRVATDHSVMSHYIGLKDQYASFDPSISPFNFLSYSERQWRFLNNRMIPLNRLRIPEYRRLHEDAGYRIVKEENTSGIPADLQGISLAPEFQHYSQQDLLVLFSWMVSTPARARDS